MKALGVSSRPSNGTTYGGGERIEVRVGFDVPLDVTGSPQLELKVGDRVRQARYSVRSVDESSLFFRYGVLAEDAAPGGIAIAADALTLNGGCIQSTVGMTAALDLGTHAIASDGEHQVDGSITTVPQVKGLRVSSRPSNGTAYGAGEDIWVRVDFDLPLEVTGIPQLELKVGDRTRQVRCFVSSADKSSLGSRYRVQAEDAAPGGIAIADDALTLNGGSIRSTVGVAAALNLGTHAVHSDSKHKVNGSIAIAPEVRRLRVTSRPSNGTAYGAGEEIRVQLHCDLPIEVTGSPQLALEIGGRTCQAVFYSSWYYSLFFWYFVKVEDLDGDGFSISRSALTLNGGSIQSMGSAPAVLDLDGHAFKRDSKHKVNGSIASPPAVRQVWVSSRPSNGTAYQAGEEIEVRVEFDLRVKVTGTPSLAVNVGDHMRNAPFRLVSNSLLSGDGHRMLFTYCVQAEDAAPEGIAIAPDALSLNGGTIRSMAAAPAVLDLGKHAFKRDSKHVVGGSTYRE